jgi:hypothetical protein
LRIDLLSEPEQEMAGRQALSLTLAHDRLPAGKRLVQSTADAGRLAGKQRFVVLITTRVSGGNALRAQSRASSTGLHAAASTAPCTR